MAGLAGSPVYITSGLLDYIVPPELQEWQKEFYVQLGANVHLEAIEGMGHAVRPEHAGMIVSYILENLEGSGYSEENPITITEMDDFSWVENGVLVKFNQWEFVELLDDDASEPLQSLYLRELEIYSQLMPSPLLSN